MLDQWDRFELSECEEIARDLDRVLPASFRFHKIETCTAGEQEHRFAVFERASLPPSYQHGFFALIPGAEPTLGYDQDHPFLPNGQQQATWVERSHSTGTLARTLEQFL